MKILFNYKCDKCNHIDEFLKDRDDPVLPRCNICGGEMQRQITTCAFTFKEGHGKGTSGGHLMRFATPTKK